MLTSSTSINHCTSGCASVLSLLRTSLHCSPVLALWRGYFYLDGQEAHGTAKFRECLPINDGVGVAP